VNTREYTQHSNRTVLHGTSTGGMQPGSQTQIDTYPSFIATLPTCGITQPV